jgi:hypothetical protein
MQANGSNEIAKMYKKERNQKAADKKKLFF